LKLTGIIWLEEIIEKIDRKHHVTQDEVREILRTSSHFRFVEKGTGEVKTSIRQWSNRRRSVPYRIFRP